MQFVDTSMLYHIVRGQSVIKLYILSSMLEVADKLFSSFGQVSTMNSQYNINFNILLKYIRYHDNIIFAFRTY